MTRGLGKAPLRSQGLHEAMVCVGFVGLVLTIFIPSEPPPSTAYLVFIGFSVLIGVAGSALSLIQSWRKQ
jgi:hypothetical protein